MWNKSLLWLFRVLITVNILVDSQNEKHLNPTTQMEREIYTMSLSECLSSIETGYGQRLAALEAKMDLILADRINSNKALDMVTDVMQLIIEIQKQNNELRTALQVLQNKTQSDKVVQAEIITDVNQTIAKQLNNLTNIVMTCYTDTTNLKSKVAIINTTLVNGRLNEFDHVAFSASLSHDITNNNIRNYKIVFDKIITNIGDGYDSNTGIFTVPYEGLYLFHWTILTRPGTIFDTELVVNGVPKRRNAADSGGGKSWNSGSSMVILPLIKNDQIWVRKWESAGTTIHGNYWPGFSGLRIA
ncbi:hypothetical protein KUTeg_009410 [Tegillarca granosa]|uniref:C1q domain-containing protein n=1 Tax=Tegillarca granosa TaxID=220873 RepID=A0ABQ9F3S2_TEGGR|nr:hypothetical protein KUTeg_009410 [Tegillarca granosa]